MRGIIPAQKVEYRVVSLGILSYFKYGHFLLENFVHLTARLSYVG